MFILDEQERVQKKTFTNWVNAFLMKCQPPMKVQDLFQDLKDGVGLCKLLQILSGERIVFEKPHRMQRIHYFSNVTTAIQFLESKNIRLVNINAADVVDGKPAIVLGLIWTIILYFQVKVNIYLYII